MKAGELIFWANRFGEPLDTVHPDAPMATVIDKLVEELYPDNGHDAAEMAHLVSLDGVLGIMLEWECSLSHPPTPAYRAHWALAAPEGCRFVAYDEDTWDDCLVLGAFIPVKGATRELVHNVGDILWRWRRTA